MIYQARNNAANYCPQDGVAYMQTQTRALDRIQQGNRNEVRCAVTSAQVIGVSFRICNPQRLQDMLQVAQYYSRSNGKGIYYFVVQNRFNFVHLFPFKISFFCLVKPSLPPRVRPQTYFILLSSNLINRRNYYTRSLGWQKTLMRICAEGNLYILVQVRCTG